MLRLDDRTKGALISALIPGDFLLGSNLGEWYTKNPYHKYDKGDILILKNRNIIGYGIRPVALVNGYEIRDRGFGQEGVYDISMSIDASFVEMLNEYGHVETNGWWKNNLVPIGVKRKLEEHQIHFKWNIENQFKRVPAHMSVQDALKLYNSKEVCFTQMQLK